MYHEVKTILKRLLLNFDEAADKEAFLELIKNRIAELDGNAFLNARHTPTQNHWQAFNVFLRIKSNNKMEKEINHSEREHAVLSASGASRWMACTPSSLLEENFEAESSFYAEEGTLAHEFADVKLQHLSKQIDVRKYRKLIQPVLVNAMYSPEMEGHVETYTTYVMNQYKAAKKSTPDAEILIEARLSIEELTGEKGAMCTNDAMVIANGVMEVIDLKYGAGIRVSAVDNPQLKIYGLGALLEYSMLYDIHTVRLTIVQPRMDSIDSWEISAEDLMLWAETELKPKAKIALSGEGEQVVGDHCKYCKVLPKCKAYLNLAKELALKDYEAPKLISDDELTEMYKQIPLLTKWFKAVTKHLYDEAMNGKKWQGLKLVDGQSRRGWTDEEKAALLIQEHNGAIEKEQYLTTKLKGIGDIEKLLGKKGFPSIMGEVVGYKKTAPSLVPESDKRPELGINKALEDFNDDI